MPAAAVAVAAQWAVAEVGASAVFGTMLVSGGTLTFAGTLVAGALGIAATNLLGFNDKPSFNSEQQGRTQVVRSSSEYRRYIYGEVMVSGVLAFADTGGIGARPADTEHVLTVTAVDVDNDNLCITCSGRPNTESFVKVRAGDTIIVGSTSYLLSQDPILSTSYGQPITDGEGGTSYTVTSYATVFKLTTPPSLSDVGQILNIKAYSSVEDTSGDKNNEYLWFAIALADGESFNVGTVYFGDTPYYDVIFNNYYNIYKHLGQPGQTVDVDLQAAFPDKISDSFRLDGTTYIVLKLKHSFEVWKSGIPNIKALVKGRKVYDPRDSTTKYSDNWALCVRDYLINGLGCSNSEVDDATVITAANICDEWVTLRPDSWAANFSATDNYFTVPNINSIWREGTVNPSGSLGLSGDYYKNTSSNDVFLNTDGTYTAVVNTANSNGLLTSVWRQGSGLPSDALGINSDYYFDILTSNVYKKSSGVYSIVANTTGSIKLGAAGGRLLTGTKVTLTTTGTLPTGLTTSTDYYICSRYDGVGYKLSSTVQNALDGISLTWSNIGTGQHSLVLSQQRRYTMNGTYSTDQTPETILQGMCSAASGAVTFQGGVFKVFAGAYKAPVMTINESDIISDVSISPNMSRQDLFNTVKGTYSSALNSWQMSDFPEVKNSTYITDDGERIVRDLSLPFTTEPVAAQRIAKILLERSRQSVTLEMTVMPRFLEVAPMDNVYVNLSYAGFVNKIFMVTQWELNSDGSIKLVLQEEAAAVYDWNLGQESTVDLSPNSKLPVTWTIDAPIELYLNEQLYLVGNNYKTKVTAFWKQSLDYRVTGYEIQARKDSGSWVSLGNTTGLNVEYLDVTPGSYDLRVRAITPFGATSAWLQGNVVVRGSHPVMATIGLPNPINPTVDYQIVGGIVKKLRATITLDKSGAVIPDGILIFTSSFDQINKIDIASGGTGGTLRVAGGVDILASGGVIIKNGSTRSSIVIRDSFEPYDLDSGSGAKQFWAQYGTSEWRKATGNTLYAITFDPPFDVDPVSGQTLNWVELSWFDDRDTDFRFGMLTALDSNGQPYGPYEVVKWGGMDQVGTSFDILNVQRGQEGTTVSSANDKSLIYYSAWGPGTTTTIIPSSQFNVISSNTIVGTADVDIEVPQGSWCGPVTCCTYTFQKSISGGLVRSNIVPMLAGNPI